MKNITPAQYKALKKWEDGQARNREAMGVRADVFDKLFFGNLLASAGFLLAKITPEGREALAAYEAKRKGDQ